MSPSTRVRSRLGFAARWSNGPGPGAQANPRAPLACRAQEGSSSSFFGRSLAAPPAAGTLVVDQVRRGDDGRLDAAHLRGALDRIADALLGEREAALHLRPWVAVPSPVEHRYPLGDVVRGEPPATEHVQVLRADPVPVRLDRAGVRELAHLDVSSAVAQHLDALGTGRGVAGAVHHEVGAEGFGQRAHGLYARLGRFVVLERDGGLGAEAPAQREPRILGCPDDDDAPRPHLLGGGHGQNADRPRTLDDDGIAHAEEAGALGTVESADTRG